MFQVIKGTETIYDGADWVRALAMYEEAANGDEHVFLWDGNVLDHEYHPELGHTN